MNGIAGDMSVTRDQAHYLLYGGVLKHNSLGSTQKCSVVGIDLETLGLDEGNTSFQ